MAETSAAVLLPEWFQPEDDDGNLAKGSFKIRCLNGMEYLELMSLGTVSAEGFQTNHQGKEFLLKRGLIAWKNVENEAGDVLLFTIENLFNTIPADQLLLVANKAFMKASLGEAERKNLQSQLKSPATPSDSTVKPVSGEDTVTAETPRP